MIAFASAEPRDVAPYLGSLARFCESGNLVAGWERRPGGNHPNGWGVAWRAGDEARRLDVMLAILPLLVMPPENGEAAPSFGAFAGARLERRARKLRRVTTLAELGPELLHRLRLDAKRLRYLGEIFAPCFPPRRMARFLRRLTVLQDWLGTINDVATTARLVRELTPDCALASPPFAAGFAVAQGMALGLAAASMPRATGKAARALLRLQALKPFWL